VTALMEALLLGIGVVGGSGVPVGVRVSVLVGPNASLGGSWMAVWLFARVISVNRLNMRAGGCAGGSVGVQVGRCAGVWVGGLGRADELVVLGAGNAAG